ncbi:MAG: glycosyltransferase family 2 protein [Deltaproteobacteria bacterium]|nr:glycosyltransferase family 2 protein [Deltaproteobacteria bacterium]
MVDSPMAADYFMPDVDLDHVRINRKISRTLFEFLALNRYFENESLRDRFLLPTARRDFPFDDFKCSIVISANPGAATSSSTLANTWFCPDLQQSTIKKETIFCTPAAFPPLASPLDLRPWLPHAGSTRLIDPITLPNHPDQAIHPLNSSVFYVTPPPEEELAGIMAFMAALSVGCIPIVIGLGRLPGEPEVNYDSAIFRVTAGPSSLATVRDLAAALTPEELITMSQAGRRIYLKNFTPAEAISRLFEAIPRCRQASPRATRPPISKQVENKHRFIDMMCASIRAIYPGSYGWKAAIYGRGRYLDPILASLAKHVESPKLIAIIDENPEVTHYQGYPVVRPENCQTPDLIILGSDRDEQGAKVEAARLFPMARVFSFSDFCGRRQPDYSPYGMLPLNNPHHFSREDRMSMAAMLALPPFRPRRLDRLQGVLVCVGYADFLHWTLPLNIEHFDRLVVVTSSEDTATRKVAERCGAYLVISDSWRDGGAAFNKGKMINAGLAVLDPDTWTILTDADTILPDHLRPSLLQLTLNRNVLYFAPRFNIPDNNQEAWLEGYVRGREGLDQVIFQYAAPYGYFQLFHPQAEAIKSPFPRIYSENFHNAGGVDLHFMSLWQKPFHLSEVLDLPTFHISHGSFATNWSGRISSRLGTGDLSQVKFNSGPAGWRQIGYLVGHGFETRVPFPEGGFLKFVRCDTEEYIIVENIPVGKGYPCFVSSRSNDGLNLTLCGICSGLSGEVALAFSSSGRILSGWGIGLIPSSGLPSSVWAGRHIDHTNFDVLHKSVLDRDEKKALINLT